jgi:2-methylcitrate dehydratase PrpD
MSRQVDESQASGATGWLARWCVDLRPEAIPVAVRREAIRHILDGYGVALAGTSEPTHQIVRRRVEGTGAVAEAHLLGCDCASSAELTALANGLAIHAQDFDDIQLSTNPDSMYGLLTHPTAPVLGAASAVAELVQASGLELLTAYVAGIEIACRVADAARPRLYEAGFHSTGTAGVFGATAAAGRLLGLPADQLAVAFGIAAPLASGYRENFGTMTKPLHAGQAASAGVFAARLAASGFTATDRILEAPRGFFAAAAGGYEPSRLVDRLGAPFYFEDPGIAIKAYPSASLSHPAYELVLELVRDHDVEIAHVASVDVRTTTLIRDALLYPDPANGAQARFSLPYIVALALLGRNITAQDFADEATRDSLVHDLMPLVAHTVDPALDAESRREMHTIVDLRLADGRVLSARRGKPYGHPDHPMSDDALDAKFRACATAVLGPDRVQAAIDAIRSIEDAASLDAIRAALHPE